MWSVNNFSHTASLNTSGSVDLSLASVHMGTFFMNEEKTFLKINNAPFKSCDGMYV